MEGKLFYKIFVLPIIISCIFMITSHAEGTTEENKTIYLGTRSHDTYRNVIEEVLPQYRVIQQTHPATQAFLEEGTGLVTIDVIAQMLLRSGRDKYHWYPQSRATVVIAIDTNRTEGTIDGWNDVIYSDATVGMSDEFIEAGCIITSMAYGLDNESPSPEQAVKHLADLYDRKRLRFNDLDAPILILFDYQAAALERSGQDRVIVVPEEGTYTFDRGIISKVELRFPSDLDLIMAREGLCTIGSCESGDHYPSIADYQRAVYPKDPEYIHKELINTREYLNREIYGTHVVIAATAIEYTLSALVPIVLFVFWIGSCQMRSMQKNVSYALLVIGVCMVLWMSVRFFKWQVSTISLANRYFWYSYYIFMLSITNFFLWMSTSVNSLEEKVAFPRWFKALLLYESFLLLLVFTNDLHQWVFVFDRGADFWEKDYTYNWGYYLVYSSSFLSLIAGVFVLAFRVWRSPKRVRILMPIIVLILMSAYTILYIKRVPWAFYGDLSLMICLFTLSFGEAAMRTGLILVNTKYVMLFDNSSLNMKIISREGEVAYSSDPKEEISQERMKRLLEEEGPQVMEVGEDLLLHSDPITGGKILWHEDIREIRELQKKVQNSVEKIKRTNEMLEKRSIIQAKQEAVNAKVLLHSQLNQEIGDKLLRLDHLANELKVLEQEGDDSRYEQVLALISLTAIYIKRRCNLLFYVEQKYMSSDAIVTYLSEILEFAAHTGLRSAPILSLKDEIETQSGILLYDFCFSILDLLIRGDIYELMLHLYTENDTICLRVIAEADLAAYRPSEKIEAQMFQLNASFAQKHLGEAQSIQLEIPMLEKEI
ncbi:MAG: histidine kinase N-terminal 7TM domain-containing protein [Peptostreptococcaceae bacterium]|nr:histidine kinase N-terminal 7TM domain-containing protein [Peptostreptococcaceae bacterium]